MGEIHRSTVDSPHKDSDAELKQTIDKTVETPVIWDAIALITTLSWWINLVYVILCVCVYIIAVGGFVQRFIYNLQGCFTGI